jgi:O-methyltransferase
MLWTDIEYEISSRGKKRLELGGFKYNDFEIWKKNFANFPFVVPLKSDCATFDYSSIEPIKLVLLDVDLYLPTSRTLPKLYERLIAGGVILVDDVANDMTYDGSHQAYLEFCKSILVEPEIIGNKCGIIRKK